MAIEWGSVIGALVNNTPQIIQAVSNKPVTYAPSMATPAYVPTSAVNGQTPVGAVADVLGLQNTANNLVKKSIGAALKQYWYVIAIPVALLAFILLKPLFTGKRRW